MSETGKDKVATQGLAIRHILINFAGNKLTPDTIELITKEMIREIENGPCSWAFKAD